MSPLLTSTAFRPGTSAASRRSVAAWREPAMACTVLPSSCDLSLSGSEASFWASTSRVRNIGGVAW